MSFFSEAAQRDDARIGIAEDAPDGGLGPEAWEPIRVGQAHGFSHSEIMTRFQARGNAKTEGKSAAYRLILVESYPHALEMSPENSTIVAVSRLTLISLAMRS